MSSIAELLKQFSQESASQEAVREENIEEGQVGAEEITVVTDETTTELEEAIEEVAETVEESEKVAETTETLIDAAESLENAVAQIQDLRLAGQRVNAVSMKIWARGVADSMEARQIPAEVYQDLMDDFGESFESTDTYTDYSTEAEEKGEGLLTKIWNMIKAAFARVRDFFGRLIAWFGKSADSIIKAGYKLRETVKDRKELKSADAKVKAKSYADLANSSNKVDASAALKEAKNAFTIADTASTAVYDASVEAANALKAGGEGDIKKFEGAVNGFDGLNNFELGNTKITIEGKQGASWYNDGKVSMKFKTTKSEKKAGDEQAPMAKNEIEALASELITFGEDIKKTMADAKRTQGKLNVDFPKTDAGKHAVEKMGQRRAIARSIQSSTALANSVRGKVAGLALSVAKKAYSFGMANANLYK